jgi:SAM-dependent methyltransferase
MEEKLKLSINQVNKFIKFIEEMGNDTLIEEPSDLHTEITQSFIKFLSDHYTADKFNKVLDVGCGSGVALEEFVKYGYNPIGISINAKEVEICRKKGFKAMLMEQSFLDFDDNSFDIIWARHVLEHSIMPYYTLLEYKRVLKNTGILYVEVPCPSTEILHEKNPYHFSMFTANVWLTLFEKAGFSALFKTDINFEIPQVNGIKAKDSYVNFYLTKNEI